MNLYLISQDSNRSRDTYTSAVVCAESEEAARNMHPDGYGHTYTNREAWWEASWVVPSSVTVKLIGLANPDLEPGVICADFFAG